ncbi:MAG: hypothetical protein V4629_00470, partial [Pseudomonadota bacterium]
MEKHQLTQLDQPFNDLLKNLQSNIPHARTGQIFQIRHPASSSGEHIIAIFQAHIESKDVWCIATIPQHSQQIFLCISDAQPDYLIAPMASLDGQSQNTDRFGIGCTCRLRSKTLQSHGWQGVFMLPPNKLIENFSNVISAATHSYKIALVALLNEEDYEFAAQHGPKALYQKLKRAQGFIAKSKLDIAEFDEAKQEIEAATLKTQKSPSWALRVERVKTQMYAVAGSRASNVAKKVKAPSSEQSDTGLDLFLNARGLLKKYQQRTHTPRVQPQDSPIPISEPNDISAHTNFAEPSIATLEATLPASLINSPTMLNASERAHLIRNYRINPTKLSEVSNRLQSRRELHKKTKWRILIETLAGGILVFGSALSAIYVIEAGYAPALVFCGIFAIVGIASLIDAFRVARWAEETLLMNGIYPTQNNFSAGRSKSGDTVSHG